MLDAAVANVDEVDALDVFGRGRRGSNVFVFGFFLKKIFSVNT